MCMTVGMHKCQVLHVRRKHVDKIQKRDLPWVFWVSVSTFHLFCPAVWAVGCQSRRTRRDTYLRVQETSMQQHSKLFGSWGNFWHLGNFWFENQGQFYDEFPKHRHLLLAILVNQKGHPATEMSWQKPRFLVLLPSNCGCKLKLQKGTFWTESIQLPLGMCDRV